MFYTGACAHTAQFAEKGAENFAERNGFPPASRIGRVVGGAPDKNQNASPAQRGLQRERPLETTTEPETLRPVDLMHGAGGGGHVIHVM